METTLALLVLLSVGCLAAASPASVVLDEPLLDVSELRCEYLEEPLGLDEPKPRLSWKLHAIDPAARDLRQSAYRILVASTPELLARDEGDLWDTGRVESSRTTHVEWGGGPLRSRMSCHWKVRAWDGDGVPTDWSRPARWTMGLLTREDWGGKWIGAKRRASVYEGAKWIWYPEGNPAESAPPGTRLFRRVLDLPADRRIVRAEMRVSADNAFALAVNGSRIAEGDRWEEPVVADLAPYLRAGPNVLAVGVINRGEAPTPAGWIARLRVDFGDGDSITLVTDERWMTHDAESEGWRTAVTHPDGWRPARELGAYPMAPWGTVASDGFAPDPWLRRSFELSDYCAQGQVHVASLGYHELYVNGTKVGEHVLTPSISELSKRVRWVTYDVHDYLVPGRNTIGLWLGGGWAHFPTFDCGDRPLVLARADLSCEDGSTTTLVTDETWRIHPSHHTLLGEWRFGRFGGERVDARAEVADWCSPELDDGDWSAASTYELDVLLSADRVEPNVQDEPVPPRRLQELDSGEWRIDMGRNFTGWSELFLRGDPGSTITLTFSEREDDECTYGQRSELVLDENGEGLFRHRFNYATGRWITIRGTNERPQGDDISASLVRNAYEVAGRFACSDPLLNQIYETVLWTYQCLSLGGYVVDCPHRERQGYGGDAHATMETALTGFAKGAFFTKWMEDWRDVQGEDGDIPHTAPTREGGGGPAWSGVCITLPWEVYLAYGDARILERNYPMMQRWLRFLETHCRGGSLQRYGDESWGFLGDWVPPGRQQGTNGRVDDHSTLFFNNCYRYYVVSRMAEIAGVLGKAADAEAYRAEAAEIRRVVHEEFYDPETASYANGEQPYLAFPLLAGLTPPELAPAVMNRLERVILDEKDGHVDSGIHGTYFLLKWLTEARRSDLVHEMVSKKTSPSWGHMLEEGATTIWEQWDGLNSRCHSSFLSVGAWFVQGIAGIRADPAHPGFEHFFVIPALVGDLEWARASYDSIHGPIASAFERDGSAIIVSVEVPVNTRATVYVPTDDPAGVTESDAPAAEAEGVRFLRHEGGRAIYEVRSGFYSFASTVTGRADR